LFAIWQVLHPDSYVEPEPSTSGTFTRLAGDTEDGSSPLTPFWQDSSTFYTAQSARTTQAFGYAYPETQSWNYTSTSDYQRSVKAAIVQLYGGTPSRPRGFLAQSFVAESAIAGGQLASVPIVSRSIAHAGTPKDPQAGHDKSVGESKVEAKAPATQSDQKVLEVHNPSPHNPGKGHDNPPKSLAPEDKYKEWIVNIRAPKHSLCGTYQVHIFIGDVPDGVDTWVVHDNNVGTYTVLGSNPLTTNCEKCRRDAGRELVVTGIIPLTETLTELISTGELRSLEANDVAPYLKEKLHWRVTQVSIIVLQTLRP
jgi:tyrosinase